MIHNLHESIPLPPLLVKKWQLRCVRREFRAAADINVEGITLGVTLLAKRRRGTLMIDPARIAALLAVVFGREMPEAADDFRRAEKYYAAGNRPMALMALALSGIPALSTRAQAQRLFAAECLLEWGDTPRDLLKHAGFIKSNPYHLGPGPGGGEFTTAALDGTSNGLPRGAGRPDGGTNLKPPSAPAASAKPAPDDHIDSDWIGGIAIPAALIAGGLPYVAEGIEALINANAGLVALDSTEKEILNIVASANRAVGNESEVATSEEIAYSAAKEFVGENTRPIYDYEGNQVGNISADGTRVVRYTSVNKPDPYINLVNKPNGGNLHLRWNK